MGSRYVWTDREREFAADFEPVYDRWFGAAEEASRAEAALGLAWAHHLYGNAPRPGDELADEAGLLRDAAQNRVLDVIAFLRSNPI